MAFTNTSEVRVATLGKKYAYDQLNRIRTVDVYSDPNGANDDVVTNNTFAGASVMTDYEETFNYDPNGNIMTVDRTGDGSTAMDDFTYHYKTASGGTYQYNYASPSSTPTNATNQLDHVDDDPTIDANYGDDVDDQAAGNYTYDEIGNLIDDNQEFIDNIEWTIYGKIRRITRDAGSTKPDLEFRYDAMGNRICKIVKPKDGSGNLLDQKQWTYTYYNRDASGNVMAVYDRDLNTSGSDIVDNITLSEQHLYGSSRVGLRKALNNDGTDIVTGGFTFTPGTVNGDGTFPVNTIVSSTTASAQPSGYRWMTRKNYELSNHLGNVYAVVTDKKQGIATTQYTTSVSYYTSDVISAMDYYAFGATMPTRTYQSDDYRYGFNGVEHETEFDDGVYSTDFRFVDTRLGRWMSADPVVKEWESPYAAYSNRPTALSDPSGMDPTDPPVMTSRNYCGEAPSTVSQNPDVESSNIVYFVPLHVMVFPTAEQRKGDGYLEGMYSSYINDQNRNPSTFAMIEVKDIYDMNNQLASMRQSRSLGNLYLVGHSWPGDPYLRIGNTHIYPGDINAGEIGGQLSTLATYLGPSSNVILLSCGAGSNDGQLIQPLADKLGVPVFGSLTWVAPKPLYSGQGSTFDAEIFGAFDKEGEFHPYEFNDLYNPAKVPVDPMTLSTVLNTGKWYRAIPGNPSGPCGSMPVNAIYINGNGTFAPSENPWKVDPALQPTLKASIKYNKELEEYYRNHQQK